MADDRVAGLNAAIERRLTSWVRGRGGDYKAHAEMQRTFVAKHQPEGGQWGASCLGDHEGSVPWPCDDVLQLDRDQAYWD